jgi:hypothetical protein
MPHVDEGRLHAYLDGELETVAPGGVAEFAAHLAECALCAARLEEARRLRGRSMDILRSVGVAELRLPDFPEVSAETPPRREPVPNHRRAMQQRATALAWAASLVVALGIGWVARDVQIGRDTAVASGEMEAMTVSQVGARAEPRSGSDRALAAAESATLEAGAEPHASQTMSSTSRPPPGLQTEQQSDAVGDAAIPVPAMETAAAAAPPPAALPAPRAAARDEAPLIAHGRIVTDAGEPLAGAQIAVPALNLGTVSRADGSYSLPIPPERVGSDSLGIRVQMIGFQPVSRQVVLGTTPAAVREDFQLHAQAVALESVVVSGSSAPQRVQARSGSVARTTAGPAAAPAAEQAQSVAGLSLQSTSAGRCSLAAVPVHRDPNVTYFTLVARRDTLLAGPGTTEYVQPPIRPGQGRAGGIYGQLATLQRVGGVGSEQVESALRRRGSREVVVVPWGTNPACRPEPWSASARWIPLGQPQFVRARLRPIHLWIEGRPTFDALQATTLVYPGDPLGAALETAAGGEAPILTADQFFSLYAVMPTLDAAMRERARAVEPLRRWRQQHPHLARRYPAAEIIEVHGEVSPRPGGR